jgi:hypothetical protein
MRRIFFGLFGLLVSLSSHAAIIDCGVREVTRLEVQGDRDDNHPNANSLVMHLDSGGSCDTNFVFIKTSHPMFNAMLSIALTAKASGKPLQVYVNSNNVSGRALEISLLVFV